MFLSNDHDPSDDGDAAPQDGTRPQARARLGLLPRRAPPPLRFAGFTFAALAIGVLIATLGILATTHAIGEADASVPAPADAGRSMRAS